MKLGSSTSGSGANVAFVHGFTQTRDSWRDIISELETFACTSIDAPGHGESIDGRRSLNQCGDDIAETMADGVLIGYSMGARMALHTALQHPDKVKKLVLVSGTAGIEDATEREQRRVSDNALADHIEAVGVEQFIIEWLGNPMFANLSTEAAQIPKRLSNSAQGLANSLRFAGTGTQSPLWGSLHRLEMPVLLVSGELDNKFTLLAQRMHSAIPQSQLVTIASCGHTVHLENHRAFTDALIRFLL